MSEEELNPTWSISTSETKTDLRTSIALNWYHILIESSPGMKKEFYEAQASRAFMIANAFCEEEIKHSKGDSGSPTSTMPCLQT